MNDAQVYAGAAAIGAVAGMRSMAAPALVGRLTQGSGNLLTGPVTAKTMTVLAIGEVIADKLPFMPKRTDKPALVTRAITGALSGAALCSSRKRAVWLGALFGAAGAVAATYAAYHLRKRVVEKLHVPDALAALAEDALAASAGALVASRV